MSRATDDATRQAALIEVYRHFYEAKEIIVPDDSGEFDFLILDPDTDTARGVLVHVSNRSISCVLTAPKHLTRSPRIASEGH